MDSGISVDRIRTKWIDFFVVDLFDKRQEFSHQYMLKECLQIKLKIKINKMKNLLTQIIYKQQTASVNIKMVALHSI